MSVVDILLKLLSFQSITPEDDGALEWIESYLDGFEAIYHNEGGVKNLFLTKEFSQGAHLCFAGHIDVVPPGEGWKSNPFVPMIDEGYVYARGAQDMKSGVAAFVAALKDTVNFQGRLSLLLTSDEEGDALYGTKVMLEHLKSIDLLPEYCIVAEPTCEERFGDTIKVGRRGSINGVLQLYGVQGHAAYPEKSKNPIHMVAPILAKIAGAELDDGDAFFTPSKLVITDIRSGFEVTNVTPDSLRLMFNVRNSTKTSKKDIQTYIDDHFQGLEYKLTLNVSADPFVTKESILIDVLAKNIEDILGIRPKRSTAGGTSDARFIAACGIDVVEFGVKNDRIHSKNERVGIDEVQALYGVFLKTIEKFTLKV
ncbi:MAG: succinyl-diaminopimelate desuccinylase [Campylobacterales bacterium]|nr:succinyl-diaminopimelate desuccinylase [Campylobacterales bacterium]